MPYLKQLDNKQVVPLWINSQDQPLERSRIFGVVQASAAETVHYAQSASKEDATAAVDAANAAFPGWSKTPITERRKLLNRVADLLEERAVEIGAAQALETSSHPGYGAKLATLCAENIREISGNITAACSGSLVPSEGATVMITKAAIGSVLIIPPWNSPSVLGPRSIAAALAAGCTVVLKASELCPLVYRILSQVFADAGLPKGVLNQVVVRREDAATITETIISHPAIRKVEFIGSSDVGSRIAQVCSKYLKPILMELGGKGPAIVRHDADLAAAAKVIAFGSFFHHGQVCMSTERIIVVEEVAEEFSRLLKDEVGTNWSEAGSAVTKEFADKARGVVESAKADGAEFLVGDNSYVGAQLAALKPTIVTGLSKHSQIRDSETFGPSATLYIVKDDEEALELANDSKYGLVGAVWTSDVIRGLEMSESLECGVVNINGCTIGDVPTMSLQGVKGSGWGSNNSVFGIQEFLVTKSISIQKASSAVQFGNGT